ncbi:retrovirus-related pol polyprotein from transposon TNT 1-94 [Tanacetum coccineum]
MENQWSRITHGFINGGMHVGPRKQLASYYNSVKRSNFFNNFNQEMQYQNEVNDIRAERIAKSANPLALLAATQQYSDNYYPAPKPQRSNATSSSTRPSASTRHKGKEIAKPLVFGYYARKKAEEDKAFEQADWLVDTDEEIDEHELEAHYSFMAWIPGGSSRRIQFQLKQPLEKVLNQKHDELVKKSLLTKSQLEGYLKRKTKSKRSSFKSKAVPSSKGRLNLLHMDLCGPMRVASINGKKYILVIVDDYSRYTWTLFLRSKDETPDVLKDFHVDSNAIFKLKSSTPRTPKRSALSERTEPHSCCGARLNFALRPKLPLSFWADSSVATQHAILRTDQYKNRLMERRNMMLITTGSDLALATTEMSVKSLFRTSFSRTEASEYDNLTLAPHDKHVVPKHEKDRFVTTRGWNFSSVLYLRILHPTTSVKLRKNNNDQKHERASFQEADLSILFVLGV